MDCRNRCISQGDDIGYFAYVNGSTCACYTKNGGCGDDGRYLDHYSFEIVRTYNNQVGKMFSYHY